MFLGTALPGSKGMGSVLASSTVGSCLVTLPSSKRLRLGLALQGHCGLNLLGSEQPGGASPRGKLAALGMMLFWGSVCLG